MAMILVKSKLLQDMKKIFSNVMLVAAAAMTFFACQKPETINPETSAEDVVLTFSSEKPAFDDETKTEWTGETIQWSKGDKISVAYTVDGEWTGTYDAEKETWSAPKLYKSEALGEAADVAQFNVSTSFQGDTEGAHVFYGVYPAPAETGFANAPVATLSVAPSQTPKADSFDPNGDLIVGVSNECSSRPGEDETISLKWERLVAHAVISLKNINGLTAEEKIENITLTAQESANLVGQQKVNLITKEVVKDDDVANVLKLDASKLTVNDGILTFWACFLPETLTSLTIVVETDKATYTREIQSCSLEFKQNARNTLSIKMGDAVREEKVVANDEVVDVLNLSLTGVTAGTTYTEWSNKKSVSEAIYAGQSAGGNESIQLRSKNNNSGIVTTSSGGVVKKVVVTWNSTTTNGRKLTVYGSNSAYSSPTDLYDNAKRGTDLGSIVFGTSTELVINGEYEYIGFRSADGAMYIDEIEVTWSTAGLVPDTTPKVEVEVETLTLTADASEGTIAVTVENIEDIEVRALVEEDSQEEVDWLTVEYADGVITYSAEENDSEEERTAYIEVYALDADDNEVVAGINVTQAGKVVVDTSFEAGDYWIVETDAQIAMMPLPGDYGYPKANLAKLVDGTYKSFEANIFTIEYREDDNCYTIKDSNDKYLYMKTDGDGSWYTSYNVSATYESDTKYQWAISANGEGKHIITNLASQYTMAYSSSHSSWGAYEDVSSYALPTLVKAEDPIAVELASISVSGQTTSYNVGEEFEFDGTVTATYNDGSTKAVTPTEVSEPDMSAAGSQTVTVSYTENSITKTVEYTINISDGNDGRTPVTLIIDGSTLPSDATTGETTHTFDGVAVTMSKGAKYQASSGSNRFKDKAILIGKLGAYIYNKTAIPGKITKFEIYANKGASAKVTVGVNFSADPIDSYSGNASNTYTSKLENLDTIYDCTSSLPSDARYFWYQVTNANNSQVQFRITYIPEN